MYSKTSQDRGGQADKNIHHIMIFSGWIIELITTETPFSAQGKANLFV